MPTQPEDYVHRIGRTGRAGADGVAISLMDETEQKMFEAIKDLTGNNIPIERIEGFEPRWWDNGGTEERPSENGRPRRGERAERGAGSRSERRTRGDSRAEQEPRPKDPGESCGKIAGRSHRNRRGERAKCALVQPNFGVK